MTGVMDPGERLVADRVTLAGSVSWESVQAVVGGAVVHEARETLATIREIESALSGHTSPDLRRLRALTLD